MGPMTFRQYLEMINTSGTGSKTDDEIDPNAAAAVSPTNQKDRSRQLAARINAAKKSNPNLSTEKIAKTISVMDKANPPSDAQMNRYKYQ